MKETTFQFYPIGIIHSENIAAKETPIQPRYAESRMGRVEVFEEYEEALSDLEGFGRVWLLYPFDRNTGWNPKVIPFRDVVERGLFSTRAPKRPNGIGLSCVKLIKVERRLLHVTDIDILDKTPIFDIKPYCPAFDCYPDEKAGWLDDAPKDGHRASDNRFDANDREPSE